MIKELNAALDASALRRAAYLVLTRYAAVAVNVPSVEFSVIDATMAGRLREVAEGRWGPDDVRLIAELESRADEYLEAFDEEPFGAAYYPYWAVMLMLIGLPVVRGAETIASLNSLWEYSERFAKHVDWELKRSRILIESADYFQRREEQAWLAHSRLTEANDEEFQRLLSRSRDLGAEYVDAITHAVADEASADYVVVFEDSGADALRTAVERGAPGLRLRLGEPIYIERMNDANLTYFRKPGYLYIWAPDEQAVASFLRDNLSTKAIVDTRRPDGMNLEATAFIAEPIKSVPAW